MDTPILRSSFAQDTDSRLLFGAAIFMLLATVSAFAHNIHVAPQRTEPYPAVVVIHAVAMFLWLALFCVQTGAVRSAEMRLHRMMGPVSSVVVIAALISGFQLSRQFSAEMNATHIFLVNAVLLCAMGILYLLGVIAAMRQHIDWHWRLMFLATLATMNPTISWATHALHLPRGSTAAAHLALFCLVPALWDIARTRNLHPATMLGLGVMFSLIGGAALIGLTPPFSDWTREFVMAARPDAH